MLRIVILGVFLVSRISNSHVACIFVSREINSTTSIVESYTRSCAGSVTDQLTQTIQTTSSSFTTDCELYGKFDLIKSLK